jgi:hypothetical protein
MMKREPRGTSAKNEVDPRVPTYLIREAYEPGWYRILASTPVGPDAAAVEPSRAATS